MSSPQNTTVLAQPVRLLELPRENAESRQLAWNRSESLPSGSAILLGRKRLMIYEHREQYAWECEVDGTTYFILDSELENGTPGYLLRGTLS